MNAYFFLYVMIVFCGNGIVEEFCLIVYDDRTTYIWCEPRKKNVYNPIWPYMPIHFFFFPENKNEVWRKQNTTKVSIMNGTKKNCTSFGWLHSQKKIICMSIWIWLRGDEKKTYIIMSNIVHSLTAKIDSMNITCSLYDLVVLAWFGYFEKKRL